MRPMSSRRIGIREVAAAAGVSVTTVSHALNGKGRLPEETRARVRQVAEELGYRPNATARNLVGGKTGLLGLVVSLDTPYAVSDFAYFTQLMTAATVAAMDRGYALVLAPPNRQGGPLSGIAVDGAIVVDPIRGDPLVEEMRRSAVPLVTTGRVVGADADDGPWVDNDHTGAMRRVLDHLHDRGGRRIALLTSPTPISYTLDLERAYRAWAAEHGMKPRVVFAREDLGESAGFDAAGELFDDPEPPDAIFASYDRLAYGTALAARSRGLSVPDDLLLAMTATESGAHRPAGPAVTTLNLHPGEIGRRAANLLADLVEEREPENRTVVVPTRLIPRASTRRRS